MGKYEIRVIHVPWWVTVAPCSYAIVSAEC